jgi:DNA-binding XRE family transcriptional regulator
MPILGAEGTRGRRYLSVLDGRQLRQLRRQNGLSQEKLADLAGVSLTTVSRLERQSPAPCRSWTLARLALALGEQQDTLARLQQAQPQEATRSNIQS